MRVDQKQRFKMLSLHFYKKRLLFYNYTVNGSEIINMQREQYL